MAKDFILNPTCSMKFDVFLNRDGNIAQEGETVAGKKTVTFSGIKSDATIDETITPSTINPNMFFKNFVYAWNISKFIGILNVGVIYRDSKR